MLGLALGLWAAVAPASALPLPDAEPAARGVFRIVALGSSSTQGIGATSPAMAYPAQLSRLFDEAYRGHPAVVVVNRGIGGEDIDDMMKRLSADVVALHPDLAIWQAGSNDALRSVPVDRFKAELRHGIEILRGDGIEVMLMEPQRSPVIDKADAKSRFVDAVREVGQAERVEVVRRNELMRGWIDGGLASPQQLIGPDNLHMTDRGYSLLAKAVLDQISSGSRAFKASRAVALSGRP